MACPWTGMPSTSGQTGPPSLQEPAVDLVPTWFAEGPVASIPDGLVLREAPDTKAGRTSTPRLHGLFPHQACPPWSQGP